METMGHENSRAHVSRDPSRSSLAHLIQGLQMLGPELDNLVQNFAYCAGLIAGSKDAPEVIIGMMEFAYKYHTFGIDTTLDAIEENSGVPVDIIIPDVEFVEDSSRWRLRTTSVDRKRPGIVVGLVGIVRDTSEPTFGGVAVIEDEKGIEDFAAVRITSEGIVILDPEHLRESNSHKSGAQVIEELYPAT